MDERKGLRSYARRVRARMAYVRGLEGALRAILCAALVVLAALLADRLLGVRIPLEALTVALAGGVLLTGLLCAFLPRIGMIEAAAAADDRAGWRERISSALALGIIERPMERALVEDAQKKIATRRLPELFPVRRSRTLLYVPLAGLAILGVALLVPSLDLAGLQAARDKEELEKKRIESAVKKLEKSGEMLRESPEGSEETKRVVRKIDALMKELQKSKPFDKKDALAKMTSLAEELRKLGSKADNAQAMARRIQKALEKDSEDTGKLGNLLRKGRLAEAVEELAQLRKALSQGNLSNEEREKLSRQMKALIDRMGGRRGLSELEKKLAEAMEGLQQGDAQALEGLEQELSELEEGLADAQGLDDALQDLEQLARAMAQGEKECPSCGEKRDGEG